VIRLACSLASALIVLVVAVPAWAQSSAVWQMDTTTPAQGSFSFRNGASTIGVIPDAGASAGAAWGFDGNEKLLWSGAPDPGTSTFSVTVHVKTSSVPDDVVGDYDLIRKGLAGDKRYWKVELFPNKANTKAFAFCKMRGYNASAGRYYGARLKWHGRTADLADDQWHTITCTKSDTGVDLYVDGVLRGHSSHVLGDIHNSKDLSIGSKPGSSWDDAYIGEMDDVTYTVG
jgi:hypothetical protein